MVLVRVKMRLVPAVECTVCHVSSGCIEAQVPGLSLLKPAAGSKIAVKKEWLVHKSQHEDIDTFAVVVPLWLWGAT